MREIKFRAWDNNAKKMFYDIRLLFANSLNDCFEEYKECGLQIMQYTGLKDKNGVEIYEGDIVKDRWEHIGKVIYTGENCGSCGCCYPSFNGIGFMARDCDLHNCEIIGNIHENPELLQEAHND